MSNYTMELRHICEHYAGLTPEEIMFASPSEIISAARTQVFDFEYPLYDPNHKTELETKILEHFYLREIGAETVGMFKLYLSRTMREIMPYFNKLYYSADLDYNPLYDVDIRRTHQGAGSGSAQESGRRDGTSENTRLEARTGNDTTNTTGSSEDRGTSSKTTTTSTTSDSTNNTTGSKTSSAQYSDNSTERNAYSATPESTIQGVEGEGSGSGNVNANYWLTDYRKITNAKTGTSSASENTTGSEAAHATSSGTQTETGSTTDNKTETGRSVTDSTDNATITDSGTTGETSSGTSSYTNNDSYIDTVTGKQGSASYASMILEYRETILNIDMMIIEALEPCFMQIY